MPGGTIGAAQGPAVICAARFAPPGPETFQPRPVWGRPQDHRQPTATYDVITANPPSPVPESAVGALSENQ